MGHDYANTPGCQPGMLDVSTTSKALPGTVLIALKSSLSHLVWDSSPESSAKHTHTHSDVHMCPCTQMHPHMHTQDNDQARCPLCDVDLHRKPPPCTRTARPVHH